MDERINLSESQIEAPNIFHNIAPAKLYEEALRYERGSAISHNGALIVSSGKKTGRSPNDKRIVDHPDSNEDIWWGNINIRLQERTFLVNRERAIDYLNTCERLYVVDGYAGADPRYRLKIRVICSRAYHALFMRNMLIRPTKQELEDFGTPDFVIFNAGRFPANRYTSEMTSRTSIDVSFERNEMLILGTEYAGEMKKGVFTVMNYLMPKRDVLSMHCSANIGPDDDTALFFGLSGTGKTTLSADARRKLIGDDEHCWTDDGIFNIEGGCYAKLINLTEASEPEIFRAVRFGTVLENVVYEEAGRYVDYSDSSITENTRGAYPIEFIPNAAIPSVGGHPKHIIFLTCDAFGVLPPISVLDPAQAMYHFISGYTAKVAGAEDGVAEPQATFSACFGAAFMVWPPNKYAELLAKRIRRHGSKVWLINTGWYGGPYGIGARMPLKHTRAMVDAALNGDLDDAPTEEVPRFKFRCVTKCPSVPDELLIPRSSWKNPADYDAKAAELAGLFRDNFKQFEDGCSQEIRNAGPE